MASTTYVDNVGPAINAAWLNDVNTLTYTGASGISGASTRTALSKLADYVSVKDFGAIGNGSTNDRTAFANAIAYCDNNGKALFIPAGNYLINTDGGTLTLKYITVLGEGTLNGASPTNSGSVISVTGTTNSLFTVQAGVRIDGLGFYYPNQTDSASPTSYPATLALSNATGPVNYVYIQNNTFFNSYKAIVSADTTTGDIGHVWITDNSIYGINTGIDIGYNLEVIKISGNTFTFGLMPTATEGGTRGYTRANGIAIRYRRGDGLWISDNMIFGYYQGILIGEGNQICQQVFINHNALDQVRYGVQTQGSGNISSIGINNNTFITYNSQSTSLAGISVNITNTGTGVDSYIMTGNHFLLSTTDSIYISSNAPNARWLNITGNFFYNFGYLKSSGAYSAVNGSATTTSIVFNGNYIRGGYNAYTNGLSGTFNVLNIVSNLSEGVNTFLNGLSGIVLNQTGNISAATISSTTDNNGSFTTNYKRSNYYDKPSANNTHPSFLVRVAAGQTFNSGTLTDLVLGTESHDKGGNFSSNTFTCPITGKYHFAWALTHDATGTAGDRWLIQITPSTGTVFYQSYVMIANVATVSGSIDLELASGVTVKMQVQRVGGTGNFVILNDGSATWFTGHLID